MFWLETGLQANTAVYNTLREAGEWSFLNVDSPGRLPLLELQGVFGFRYHFFRTFSFKAIVHYGLTPAYRRVFDSFDPNIDETYTLRYRFLVFKMGLSYLFPLKK